MKKIFSIAYSSKKITFKNQEIATYTFGSGSKNVLLLPPYPAAGLFYLYFFKDIDISAFTFYTLDIPGWAGLSNFPHTFKNPGNEYLEIILKLIEIYNINSCNLLGYSFGGGISIALKHRLKEKIQKQVLVSPVFSSELINSKTRKHGIAILKSLRLGWLFRLMFVNYFSKQIKKHAYSYISKDEQHLFEKAMDNTSGSVLINDANYIFNQNDLRAEVRSLDPDNSLVLYSENEPKFYKRHATFIKKVHPKIKPTVISGKHEDFLLKPDKDIRDSVLNFLRN